MSFKGDVFTMADALAAVGFLCRESLRPMSDGHYDGHYMIPIHPATRARVMEMIETAVLEEALEVMPASAQILGWERWRYELRRRAARRSPHTPMAESVLAWLRGRS